ncbi:MAG: chromosome segregation protein SMC [Elusimicrobiota bacterium]
MYLKRIELCGFKSFADRACLEFEPGTTVIVGPNGCGKTNVSDAIRWVMGEQSAKQMRGNRMEDVIFNGTSKRPAQSMAEVSLVFDNSQNTLPLDFPEVVVTRRLFRSGESEYLINKSPCRLKDIRDLFLDTGLGVDAYSLMEQGKVEFIISAKPEERRTLFEEAAGIAKFKARREEALHKMERVDNDLLRLNDIVTEVKKQISALDAQVRKTRQYQKYKEELRTQEIGRFAQNYSQLKTNSLTVGEELIIKENNFEEASAQVRQKESALSADHLSLTEEDELLVKQHEKVSVLDSEIARSEEKADRAKGNQLHFNQRIQQLTEEISAKETSFQLQLETEKELAGQISEIELKLLEEQEKLAQEETKWPEVKKQLADILENIDRQRGQIMSFVQKKSQINNELTGSQVQGEHLTAKIEKLITEHDQLSGEKEQLLRELQELQETLAGKKNFLEQLEQSWTDFGRRKEKNRLDLGKTQTGLLECQRDLDNQRTRQAALQEVEEEQTSRLSGCQAVLQQNLPGIHGRLIDLLKVPEKLEKILEVYLGAKLFHIIAENSQAAEKAIEHLKFTEGGWASFLILDRLPETNPLDIELPQNIVRQIGYEEKYRQVVEYLLGKIFLKEDTIYGEAFLQGGSFSKQQPGFLARRREIEAFQTSIAQLEEKIPQFTAQLTGLIEQQQSLAKEEREIAEQLQTTKIQLAELSKVQEGKDEDYRILTKELLSLQQEKELTEKNIEERKTIISALSKALEENTFKEMELAESLKTLEQEKEKIKAEEERINAILTQIKVSVSGAQERYNHLKITRNWLIQEKENLTGDIGQRKEEIALSAQRIEEEKKLQSREAQKIEELFGQKQIFEQELEKIRLLRQERQENIAQEESALRSLRQTLNQQQEILHQQKMNFQQLSAEMNHIQQRLQQDYNTEIETALQTPPEKMLTREEIEKLKKRIETLGAVNLAAPEEYTQLEERYKFLTTQQEDLLKAKADLLSLINKINLTTRSNFENTFNQVRQNFKDLFCQLFQGGEADLALTDQGNLLETGVDILVQPPGKKLQHINLLSGGEKALTAIALLFAFFLVKPTPFCLMDEVDAPLDDHNLNRFTNLLKEAAGKSQFLIISHNKKTMSMADVLYGVTMEESGVSKVISVRFQKSSAVAPAAPEEPVLVQS